MNMLLYWSKSFYSSRTVDGNAWSTAECFRPKWISELVLRYSPPCCPVSLRVYSPWTLHFSGLSVMRCSIYSLYLLFLCGTFSIMPHFYPRFRAEIWFRFLFPCNQTLVSSTGWDVLSVTLISHSEHCRKKKRWVISTTSDNCWCLLCFGFHLFS